jgi:cysteine-rich repeat protein
VKQLNLFRPDRNRPIDPVDVENANAIFDALKPLGLTLLSRREDVQTGTPVVGRDHCSAEALVKVPHPAGASGQRLLVIGAIDTTRHRMRGNRLTLVCAPNPAVCGNGTVELGEQCDDGNTIGCDGCSATCRTDGCGDGVVNCSEQCDDGAANGTPGSRCTATCREAPPSLRIPGGGKRQTDCFGEWSIETATPALTKKGLPNPAQSCTDGDPSCDFDPAAGRCTFRVWQCVGAGDDRLGCAATPVGSVEVVRPTTAQGGSSVAAREALVGALGAMAFPAGPGEVCSPRFDVTVPAGRAKISFKTRVRAAGLPADGDALKLSCRLPRP